MMGEIKIKGGNGDVIYYPHTIISEVCFNKREFHSSIIGVILCFLSIIFLALSIILNFLSTLLSFCPLFLSTIFIIWHIFSLFWGSYYRTCYH